MYCCRCWDILLVWWFWSWWSWWVCDELMLGWGWGGFVCWFFCCCSGRFVVFYRYLLCWSFWVVGRVGFKGIFVLIVFWVVWFFCDLFGEVCGWFWGRCWGLSFLLLVWVCDWGFWEWFFLEIGCWVGCLSFLLCLGWIG